MNKSRKVLVSIPFTRTVRSFWITSFKQELLKRYELVTLTSLRDSGEVSEGLQYPEISKLRRKLIAGIIHAERMVHIRNLTNRYGIHWFKTHSSLFRLALLRFSGALSSFLRPLRHLIFSDKRIRAVLESVKPDFVLLNCPELVHEVILAEEATRLKIPLVYNPDGSDLYSIHPVVHDGAAYLVHGPAMRRDALRHGLPEEKLVSIPNYIYEGILKSIVPKAKAKADLGVAPDERLIVFFEPAIYLFGREFPRSIVDTVVQAISSGKIPKAKLLIRTLYGPEAPKDSSSTDFHYYNEKYGHNPAVLLRPRPPGFADAQKSKVDLDPFKVHGTLVGAADFISSSLSHSTIEFGFFGVKPVVCKFDGYPGVHQHVTSLVFYEEVLKSGVPCAANPAELIEQLQSSEFDPRELIKRFTYEKAEFDKLERLIFGK